MPQLCLTLCNPMDCCTPGFLVLHYFSEFAQTHVRSVGDAIQLSHPLSTPSPPDLNLSHHQSFPMEANSFTKLCYSIGYSIVFPPGCIFPFNLQILDVLISLFWYFRIRNQSLYRLQISVNITLKYSHPLVSARDCFQDIPMDTKILRDSSPLCKVAWYLHITYTHLLIYFKSFLDYL